jgi:hypothetical protein
VEQIGKSVSLKYIEFKNRRIQEGSMKKLLSGIIVIALMVTTIAASTSITFAGTSESEDLQKAIATVKRAVTIPEALSEFSYFKDEDIENENLWGLNWSSPEDKGYISAYLEGTDTITSYYCNLDTFYSEGLAKITKEQAEKVADSALKKMLPKYAQNMKLEKSENLNGYDSDYYFSYKMYINGVPCDFITVSIGVNKYAGELSHYNYSCSTSDFAITSYPSKDKAITEESAKSAYIKELGPELKYLSNYDYAKKTLKMFTAYQTNYNNRAIDAETGKVIDLYSEYRYGFGSGATDATSKAIAEEDSENIIDYTEKELSEIEKTAGLIDKTKAEKLAKELVSAISGKKLSSASLSVNYGPDEKYVWHLSFDEGFVALDAKSGILLNFYSYKNYDSSSKDIGLEKAKSIADNYLKKACEDKLEQVIWSNEDAMGEPTYDYGFVYTRQVNGISFDENSIYISVNRINGDINSYSRTWYDSVEFPDLEGVVGQEAAFNAVDEHGNFGLVYKKCAEDKVALVYDFINDENYIIDAYSGARLSWEGQPYKVNSEYTDIKGHWAESVILELKDNGYYLEGENFAPKAKTTQIEFFRYLYSPQQEWYSDDEEFYDMLVSSKIIKKEEVNATANITRQDAAKFIIRYLGYEKLANKSSVFKNMFKDKIDNTYLGYASSVYGLGIMKGDSKGKFNGTNTLSHAEAAVVIYNTLSVE